MRFITISLLFHFTFAAKKPTCDSSDLQVDKFQLSAFTHIFAEGATVSSNEGQNLIYLPKKVYDNTMYLLGAQKVFDLAYGVPCTGTYPNLVFTFLGNRELNVAQKYYVDQKTRDSNYCKVLLDYKADDSSYEFPLRFRTNICRLID